MATPTWAEVWTQFKNLIWILENLDNFANSDTDNWVGMEDTLAQSLEGDFTPDVMRLLRSNRGNISAILAPSNVRALFRPFIRELGKVIGAPETTDEAIWDRIITYMVDNSEDINSRNLTRGSISAAGGNTGNVTVRRLTEDENGEPLESSHLETKTIECIADQNQVNLHSEKFEIRGVERELDELDRQGSGFKSEIIALSPKATKGILQNPSFSQFAGTAGDGNTITSVTGWTATSDITNFEINESITYRGIFGEATPRSLRVIANDTISQTLSSTTKYRFDPRIPYWMQFAMYRRDTATGTLTAHFGGISRAITIGNQTDDTWAVYGIESTPSSNLYYKNFAEDSLDIKFVTTSLATGTIHIDDVIIGQWSPFDGTWWCVSADGATHTAPLREDSWTATDSLAGSEAIIAKWVFRANLPSLPSDNAGAETIADPS